MADEIRVRPAGAPKVIDWDFGRDAPVMEIQLKGEPTLLWWSAFLAAVEEKRPISHVVSFDKGSDVLTLTPVSEQTLQSGLKWLGEVLFKANSLANDALSRANAANRAGQTWYEQLPKPPEDV